MYFTKFCAPGSRLVEEKAGSSGRGVPPFPQVLAWDKLRLQCGPHVLLSFVHTAQVPTGYRERKADSSTRTVSSIRMISGQDRNAAKSLDRDIPALANARGRRALFVAVGLLLVLQGSANQESEGDSSREQYYDGEWQCLAFVDPHDGYVSTFVSSRAICTLNLRLHVTHAPTTGSQKSSRVSRSCSESTAWTLLLRGTSGPARARPPCRRPGASHAPSTNPRRALPGGRSATSRRRKTSRTTPRRSSRTLSSTCRLAPHRAPRPSVPRHARAHALRPRHVRSSRARTSSSTSPSPARTVRAPRPPPPPEAGGLRPGCTSRISR